MKEEPEKPRWFYERDQEARCYLSIPDWLCISLVRGNALRLSCSSKAILALPFNHTHTHTQTDMCYWIRPWQILSGFYFYWFPLKFKQIQFQFKLQVLSYTWDWMNINTNKYEFCVKMTYNLQSYVLRKKFSSS